MIDLHDRESVSPAQTGLAVANTSGQIWRPSGESHLSYRPRLMKYFQPLIIPTVLVFSVIGNGCKAKATEPVVKPNPSSEIVVGYYFNFQNGYDFTQIMYGNLTHVAHAFAIP